VGNFKPQADDALDEPGQRCLAVTEFLRDPALPPPLDLSVVDPALLADAPDRLPALAADLVLSGDLARGGEYVDLLEHAQPPIEPESRPAARLAALRSVRFGLTGQMDQAVDAALAARGQLDEARLDLEHALAFRRNLTAITPWHAFEPTLLLARVLLELGDRAGAAELAANARDVLTALPDGAEAQQARLAELDQRIAAGQRVRPLAVPLTEREVAVLRLLRGTQSLREIGQELYVSANTIKTHTQAIYRKLGVSTRHDAVAQGKQAGIL
jgi:ATP/maltotriose-dependent transcriptional regulator MalT